MKRLFVAVELDEHVVEQLVIYQSDLRELLEEEDDLRIKWTRPEHLHVTIKFLGQTDPDDIPALCEALDETCSRLAPFEVEARDVGFFPNPARARIIWSGFDTAASRDLVELHEAVEHALTAAGAEPDERSFVPHVTLGRVKSRRRPDFAQLGEDIERRSHGACSIGELILYESKLDHRGPRYSPVARFELGT